MLLASTSVPLCCRHARPDCVAVILLNGSVNASGFLRRRYPTSWCAKGMPWNVWTLPEFPAIVAAGEAIMTVGDNAAYAGRTTASMYP